jgi:hypothetical protein
MYYIGKTTLTTPNYLLLFLQSYLKFFKKE